jgi:hypothetical protein
MGWASLSKVEISKLISPQSSARSFALALGAPSGNASGIYGKVTVLAEIENRLIGHRAVQNWLCFAQGAPSQKAVLSVESPAVLDARPPLVGGQDNAFDHVWSGGFDRIAIHGVTPAFLVCYKKAPVVAAAVPEDREERYQKQKEKAFSQGQIEVRLSR